MTTATSSALASPVPSHVDDYLNAIGETLQLSESAYNLARQRYHAVADWLNAEGSSLDRFDPQIFSQGSFRIRTTVKPIGESEYDIDLVCVVDATPSDFPEPVALHNLIEERLKEHGTYRDMIERKRRCIRLNYANEFHMDILPACPNPSNAEFHGESCLLVPDRDLKDWKDSNPKGFARWFEFREEQAVISFGEKAAEPVPEQQAYEDKTALNRGVQLIKRHRDFILSDLAEHERPISVVLTTLAARTYTGTGSVIDALERIALGIAGQVSEAESLGSRLVVKNPTNENEDLSERWDDAANYSNFKSWLQKFTQDLGELRQMVGVPQIVEKLKLMFGENVTNAVVTQFAERLSKERCAGNLAVASGSGIVVLSDTPKSTPILDNTFHGEV